MKRFANFFHPAHFISVRYQLFFLICTLTILFALLYKPFVEFHPAGPHPKIIPLEQITHEEEKPAFVHVGMHVTDFLRFDTVKNEFIINAYIWFDYDVSELSPETIDAFGFTKGTIEQKAPPIIERHGQLTRALYAVRVHFSTILDFSRFPLDDHRIFLNLINRAAPAEHLVYVADPKQFIISKNLFISGWHVAGNSVKSGLTQIELGDQDALLQNKTVFEIDLSKNDVRQLMLILLPLLFLFYLGLFAFSIPDVTLAMTLPLATISGLFAYSFVIQIIAPAVGYMMMSDYIFFYFLMSAFVILLVKALAVVPETHVSHRKLKMIEGCTVLALQIGLIVTWYLLLDVRGL